jgi:hypothetical protein
VGPRQRRFLPLLGWNVTILPYLSSAAEFLILCRKANVRPDSRQARTANPRLMSLPFA